MNLAFCINLGLLSFNIHHSLYSYYLIIWKISFQRELLRFQFWIYYLLLCMFETWNNIHFESINHFCFFAWWFYCMLYSLKIGHWLWCFLGVLFSKLHTWIIYYYFMSLLNNEPRTQARWEGGKGEAARRRCLGDIVNVRDTRFIKFVHPLSYELDIKGDINIYSTIIIGSKEQRYLIWPCKKMLLYIMQSCLK